LHDLYVRLQRDDQSSWSQIHAKPDGSFTLRNLLALNYQLQVTAPAGAYLKAVRLGERTLTAPIIDMARADGPLTIVLGTDDWTA
jgi:hypothetical protein